MEISNATRFDLDRCILEFDKALRVLYGEPVARRPSPADAAPRKIFATKYAAMLGP